MAGGIDWFRWHHGSVTDPKFQLVARKAGARLPDVLAVWAFVLEKASAAEFRGNFGEIDCEAVDCLFGLDDGTTAAILEQMVGRKLIADEYIVAWDKRQPKRERDDDTAAERKRRQREREASESQSQPDHAADSHVTPCHATSHQKTPRGEESRGDTSSSLRSDDEAPEPGADTPKPKTKRGTRLPDDWALTKTWGDWALAEFPHWTAEIVRIVGLSFGNHWKAKTGKDATKRDWFRTWQNWCISDITQRAHPPPRLPTETDYQRAARVRAEEAAGSLAHIVAAKAPGAKLEQPANFWEQPAGVDDANQPTATALVGSH